MQVSAVLSNTRLSAQKARLVARTRTVKAAQARYEQLQSAEQQVLRDPNRPSPAPAKDLIGNPPADDATDPFGNAQPIQPQAAPAPATTTELCDSARMPEVTLDRR